MREEILNFVVRKAKDGTWRVVRLKSIYNVRERIWPIKYPTKEDAQNAIDRREAMYEKARVAEEKRAAKAATQEIVTIQYTIRGAKRRRIKSGKEMS